MIRVVHPGSRIRMLTFSHPGSRGQKDTQSRIPDPDPQHCVHEYRHVRNRYGIRYLEVILRKGLRISIFDGDPGTTFPKNIWMQVGIQLN
jgi:hypothetical protein